MLRMDGSTDEGRAYGPFPVAPSHPVQSASARLHPCAFGMGGASLRVLRRGGDKVCGEGGCFDSEDIPRLGVCPLLALSGHHHSQLGYRPPAPEMIVAAAFVLAYAPLQPDQTLVNERRILTQRLISPRAAGQSLRHAWHPEAADATA